MLRKNTLKATARDVRRERRREFRRAYRRRRREIRRCFWSWPLGHEWVNFGTEEPDVRCVSCDHSRDGRVSVV